MAKPFETMIRARVTETQKAQLKAVADWKQLAVSAAMRESLREYLAKYYPAARRQAEQIAAGSAPPPEPEPAPPPPPAETAETVANA
jgi:hypothetical protein